MTMALKSRRRPPREQGFTLIELLVAMVAGSLVLAGLSWTLASLGRELGASRATKPRYETAAVAPVLASLVEQMIAPAQGEPPIVAERTRLSFVTAPPSALGAVGPVRVTLSVRPAGGSESLLARFEPADPAAAFPPAARSERILIRDYREIRFEYRKPPQTDEALPPRLVTVHLTDAEGRRSRLSATPRNTASGACRFDPISMSCRR